MNKYEIVTIGSAFQDLFVFSNDFKVVNDRSFKSGKSLSFDYGAKNDIENLSYQIGGSAINSAVSFSKIGYNSAVTSFVGTDQTGEKIIDLLRSNNIDYLGSSTNKETNTSIILSCSGDRTILAYHGQNDYNDLTISKSLKTDWFYLAPIGSEFDKLENKIIENIAKNSTGFIWNPGPTQIKKKASAYKHLLRLCNIIVLNKEEIFSFTSCGRVEEAMRKIYQLGSKIIVVTDGKNGSFGFDGSVYYKIDTSADERVDATGAGDAFASTFAARAIKECCSKPASHIVSRESMIESLRWAVINSGSVVSKVGSNEGLLTTDEILERLKKLAKLEPTLYNR